MLVSRHGYQRHVYLTSASAVTGSIYSVGHSITGYFNLREINNDLQRQNATLESELLALRQEIDALRLIHEADTLQPIAPLQNYSFILADVINNSVSSPYNFITLNRGEADGIMPEMGVIDQNGVVGVVNVTGEHFSRVISLLNPDFRLSCKVKGSEAFGSLVWDGRNPRIALLEELPKHSVFAPGDTVITSGFSAVFPEGIPVGTVLQSASAADDNFYTLRIQLLTDFSTLSTVRVVSNDARPAIQALETTRK